MCVLSTDTLNKFPLLYQTNLDPTFQASASLYMPYQGLGEMFEGDSADMSAEKFPLTSMGGRAEGLACADPGARTPIGVSGNFLHILIFSLLFLPPLFKITEGVVVGSQIFAWAPK